MGPRGTDLPCAHCTPPGTELPWLSVPDTTTVPTVYTLHYTRAGPPGCAPRWHANAGRDENPVRAHHASGLAKLRRRRRRWRRRHAEERTLHWPDAGSTVRRQMLLPLFKRPALGGCDLELIQSGNSIIDV